MITIAKDFIWQMSHRLTFHKGLCKNIHGHSYKLRIYLTGELDENGMIIDFYDLQQIVDPFVMGVLDHAFLCSSDDTDTIEFIKKNNWRHFVMDKTTTCENMCYLFIDKFKPELEKIPNIYSFKIRVYETEDAFAELDYKIK
jgi:6-pyruvoyltetrahydropterin/6-carboxytetrahydropterin synthase